MRFPKSSGVIAPLAERMRPTSLEEFVGQGHLVGEGRLVCRADRRRGPPALLDPLGAAPGPGKTTLARLLARLERGASSSRSRPCSRASRRSARPSRRPGGTAAGDRRSCSSTRSTASTRPSRTPSAGRRGRDGHPDRCHDREPLVRGERRAAVAVPRRHLNPLTEDDIRDDPPPGPGRRETRLAGAHPGSPPRTRPPGPAAAGDAGGLTALDRPSGPPSRMPDGSRV